MMLIEVKPMIPLAEELVDLAIKTSYAMDKYSVSTLIGGSYREGRWHLPQHFLVL